MQRGTVLMGTHGMNSGKPVLLSLFEFWICIAAREMMLGEI
jgi:hypothetical protein